MKTYRDARRETIRLYAGSPEYAASHGVMPSKMWGNLIQLSGLSHVVTLAYGDPKFDVVANVPEVDEIVERLDEFMKRWPALIRLGDTSRSVALDSFVGWGIFFTGLGKLPPQARHLTGQEVGPVTERVDQDYLLWDGSASCWDEVGYIGHMFDVPLDEARSFSAFQEYNPEAADALQEFGISTHQMEASVHDRQGMERNPQAMTRLARIWFPGSNVIATWPVRDETFGHVANEPLLIEPYTGHHTGPYTVESHLDVPNNLIPVARVEGTKRLSTLFNELMEINSNAALEAKWVNMYDQGNEREIERLRSAPDRSDVPVANVNAVKPFVKPGPDQSVTAHMGTSMALFKELSGNLDDTLGLNPTAGTVGQSNLIRSRTNALGAEARRRHDAALNAVAVKLAHLALASTTLRLPMRRPLPHATIMQPLDWMPRLPDDWAIRMAVDETFDPSRYQARSANADDYSITIVQGSLNFRAPEERLAALGAALGRISQLAQLVAAGMPFDIGEYVEIEAKYGDLPELRNVAIPFLPDHKARKDNAELNVQRQGVGEYTRHNVSERSNGGALTQMLSQVAQPAGLGGGE